MDGWTRLEAELVHRCWKSRSAFCDDVVKEETVGKTGKCGRLLRTLMTVHVCAILLDDFETTPSKTNTHHTCTFNK